MDIRELKAAVDAIDPDKFNSQVFVIVGQAPIEGQASGTDVASATLSFDNGGPVFVLTLEVNE